MVFGKQADVAGKHPDIAGDVATAFVAEPFDLPRKPIQSGEPLVDGWDHEVAHVVAGDTARGADEAHCLAVAAVESKSDAHAPGIVAGDLEAVGAPAGVALWDG
jgi:hypothetical protein